VELFFSGMAWYASEHPAWAKDVFHTGESAPASERQAVENLYRELIGLSKS
jgi:hypothetical protein